MKNISKKIIITVFFFLTFAWGQEEIAVTITNVNMGLVRETRAVDLKKGIQQIELEEIPSEIDPTSVLVESPEKKFEVLEQNYEFDLISVDKLLDKSIGYRIQIVHPGQGTIEGTLLSFSGQNIVMRDRDGQLQVIPRNPEQRLELLDYEKTQSTFTSRPTLVWLVDSRATGNQRMNLSYLTNGMNWRSDYVGLLNKDDTKLSIAGWVTVTNKSGKHFKNTSLKLMAGDINIIERGKRRARPGTQTVEDFMLGAGEMREKSFFDYHLYTLARKTDLLNNQVKQIQLFPEVTSKVTKKYQVESNDPEKVKIVVSVKNSEENNLGKPLPGGRIRIYKSDGEDVEFVGENEIEHTAKDEKIDVEVGAAFDIVSERKVISTDRKLKRSRRQNIEYILRNHKDSAVSIEILERFSPYYEVELHSSSHPLVEKEAGLLKFEISVPEDSEKILNIDYSTRW